MAIFVYPPVTLSVTPGPVSFVSNGTTTSVSENTGTPSLSKPLPVKILNSVGTVVSLPATLGSKSAATSLATTASTEDIARVGIITETAPATDTASSGLNGRLQRIAQRLTSLIGQLPATLGIKTAALSLSIAPASDAIFKTQDQTQTGLFDEDLTVSTAAETFTAPAGAFACLIQADDTNATNIRVKMGGAASATSGIQFQGGRSEFYQGGSNISYCAESGTGQLSVQWFIKS